jgi:hypothetical protein
LLQVLTEGKLQGRMNRGHDEAIGNIAASVKVAKASDQSSVLTASKNQKRTPYLAAP